MHSENIGVKGQNGESKEVVWKKQSSRSEGASAHYCLSSSCFPSKIEASFDLKVYSSTLKETRIKICVQCHSLCKTLGTLSAAATTVTGRGRKTANFLFNYNVLNLE